MLIKKLLAGFLSAALCCQMVIPARATEGESGTVTEIFCQEQVIGDAFAESGRHVLLIDTEASWYGMLNGQVVDEYGMFESVNTDGHLLYPVRSISQYLGFTVDWDSTAQTVVLHNANGKQVIFTIGETIAIVNGEPQRITAAPVIIEDKLMLPIRALMEALDGYVEYDPTNVLTLMDDAADLTAAETEALALMQQVFLQEDGTRGFYVHGAIRLAQIDNKTYYRIGRDGFYCEQNGIRKRINLGKDVQYVLGIDGDKVYYVTGSANKEGAFVNGHLCRADLDGNSRQTLAEYDDFMLKNAISKDEWHSGLPTYFLHGNDDDYIIVYGYPSRYGGHSLYHLEDTHASRLLYLNSSECNWVLFDNELYFTLQYFDGIPTGLHHFPLSPDIDGEHLKMESDLTGYFFLELLPLSGDSLLAIVNPYDPDTFVEYELPDSTKNTFGLIDMDALSMKLVRTAVPPEIILAVTDDGGLLYINTNSELCRIQLP